MKYLAILVALVLLIPLYWMIAGSFRDEIGVMRVPPSFLPTPITLRNWQHVFIYPLWRWTGNSLFVGIGASIVAVSFSLAAAYGIGAKKFRGHRVVYWAFMASLMLPAALTLVPGFLLIRALGLYNRLLALVIPSVFNPFMIAIFVPYMQGFPREYLDAAKIDGATEMSTFLHIVVPLSRSMWTTAFLLNFNGTFLNILWPMIILRDSDKLVLTIGLARLLANRNLHLPEGLADIGVLMATSVYTLIPILIVFLAFQRHFVKFAYAGGTK